MAVTAHAMPYALQQIGEKQINLLSDTFQAALFVGALPAWNATSEAYKFVSDFVGAPMTEVSGGGYARVSLAGVTFNYSGEVVTWTCTSPIGFGGSTPTISAGSMLVFDTSGTFTTDATRPVILAVDFGGSVASTAAPWTYTVNASGLLTLTAS